MFSIVPTTKIIDADGETILEAIGLLREASDKFFAAHPERTRKKYFGHHASPHSYAVQFVAWLFSMYEEDTKERRDSLTRADLEAIFSDAEKASDEDSDMIAPVTKVLYGLWDELAAKMPALTPEDYFGSAAETSGDYGRLYHPRRMTRVPLSELPGEMRDLAVALAAMPGVDHRQPSH